MAIFVSPWLTQHAHAQTLTMRAALSRALAASPRLTAAERDVGIATGQRIQAGALLNPELSYEQDNSFGSGIYRGTRSAETTSCSIVSTVENSVCSCEPNCMSSS